MLREMSDSIYPKDCNPNLFLQHEGIANNPTKIVGRSPWCQKPIPASLNAIPFNQSFNRNTVQKVAGTLRVPSAETQKALRLGGYGTWNVPTTLLH